MQMEAFRGLLEKYQDFTTNPGAESVEKVEARLKQDTTHLYPAAVSGQGHRAGSDQALRRSARKGALGVGHHPAGTRELPFV